MRSFEIRLVTSSWLGVSRSGRSGCWRRKFQSMTVFLLWCSGRGMYELGTPLWRSSPGMMGSLAPRTPPRAPGWLHRYPTFPSLDEMSER
eukprot:1140554-Amorphochlora_amoeboformis.AAC.2